MINLDFPQILTARINQTQLIDLNGGLDINGFLELHNFDSIEVLKPRFKGDLPAIIHYDAKEDIYRIYAWLDKQWTQVEEN